ncbi:MAG: inorganic phosphate transporter [Parachlamydiaceae bacterium]
MISMITPEIILFICVVVAGFYMAWNIGANDVANAMGTSVGSGALSLKQAVVVAAVLEFAGAFFFGSHVSETIQTGIVDTSIFKNPMVVVHGMLAALLAAGAWLQIASYYGWPVSTTHSIVGAVVGFGAAVGGVEAIYWENISFIASSWIISPILGGLLSFAIFNILRQHVFYARDPVRAAKRLTPWIVSCVIFIICLLILYKGLHNVDFDINFIQSFLLSIVLSGIGYAITKLCLHYIAPASNKTQQSSTYHPEVSNQLEKARRHLLQVQAASRDVIQYQATEILNEIETLSESLKQKEETGKESAEYALVEKIFGYLQIMSACLMAFAHGANDVANAIGPLAAAVNILETGVLSTHTAIPTWTLALGGIGIVIGLATWGWRVIETIGKKITELTPTRGFSAEFGTAVTILLASRLGMPVSTTHTLVGSVIGVGLARGIQALDLRTMRYIVISWVITVPAGALISIAFFYLINLFF